MIALSHTGTRTMRKIKDFAFLPSKEPPGYSLVLRLAGFHALPAVKKPPPNTMLTQQQRQQQQTTWNLSAAPSPACKSTPHHDHLIRLEKDQEIKVVPHWCAIESAPPQGVTTADRGVNWQKFSNQGGLILILGRKSIILPFPAPPVPVHVCKFHHCSRKDCP